MLSEGQSVSAVARTLGVSRGTVQRVLKNVSGLDPINPVPASSRNTSQGCPETPVCGQRAGVKQGLRQEPPQPANDHRPSECAADEDREPEGGPFSGLSSDSLNHYRSTIVYQGGAGASLSKSRPQSRAAQAVATPIDEGIEAPSQWHEITSPRHGLTVRHLRTLRSSWRAPGPI